MSNRASLLASLTGDEIPAPSAAAPSAEAGEGSGGGGGGVDEGLSNVCIDSTTDDGITNQKEGNGNVVQENGEDEAGLFTVDDDGEEEADLFGSIPNSSGGGSNAGKGSKSSGRGLLEGSGLMSGASSSAAAAAGLMGDTGDSSTVSSGGGLFDEVDAAAERERLRLEAEEKERQRKIQEQKEAEERERVRREQERLEALERERLAALKRQQEQEAAAAAAAAAQAQAQAQMQQMSLNSHLQHQQQQQQQQQDVFYRPDAAAPSPYSNHPGHHQQTQPQQPINAGYGASSYYYSTSGQQTTTAPHAHQPPYHPHPSTQPQPPQQPPPPPPQTTTAPLMHGRYQQQQQQQQQPQPPPMPPPPPPSAPSPSVVSSITTPSLLAGMHVGHNPNVGGIAPRSTLPTTNNRNNPNTPNNPNGVPPPLPAFQPFYGLVTVSEPILVQGSGLFAGPPHWTYGITVRMNRNSQTNGGTLSVRRRFRHFVALEDRLRVGCPGAVLPPRPEKHAARAIEEASTRQSAQFALQRAAELETYLNSLINHPICGSSDVLRLFLTLQDHIGVAWPEVSSSAITRLSAVSNNTAAKITEGTSNVMQDLGVAQQQAAGEDNAEILALVASEGVRIGAVSQAVPKMEGTLSLLRDQADRSGVVGLELSKLAKDVQTSHPELGVPLDLLSSALLRAGRRSKRLSVELSAALVPFTTQYKLCRYERMAFADRRNALAKRTQARQKADQRATKLHLHQSSLQTRHNIPALERMEMEAAMSDEFAGEAVREADKIGATLLEEIKRVAGTRTEEWSGSVKVLASSMKEACTERVSIWESVREQFEVEFPDFATGGSGAGAASGGTIAQIPGMTAPVAVPQSEVAKEDLNGTSASGSVMGSNGLAAAPAAVSYRTM